MTRKICLIIPSLHAGGMERVIIELAVYFCIKPNLEVHLIMYGINPEVFYQIPENVIIHKPKFKFVNQLRFGYIIKTILFLRREIKQIRPNSILSFGEYWNSLVLIASLGLKYPVFVSDRCQPSKSLGKTHDALRKLLYPKTKGVIIQTQTAKEIYQKILPRTKLFVLGNPIREIKTDNTQERENIVLSIGRLINTKHHDELIKLFVKINAPNWKLVIIGGNAQKQNNLKDLQNLIKVLGAETNIVLTGSQKDVDSYYKRSKIFAFTSSSEGFPNVIGEAMAAGMPVVAFDCIAGPSEMIEDGVTGFLVPLHNYYTFEQKLRELMMNEQLQKKLGQNGQMKIVSFASNKICEKYYQIITSDI